MDLNAVDGPEHEQIFSLATITSKHEQIFHATITSKGDLEAVREVD